MKSGSFVKSQYPHCGLHAVRALAVPQHRAEAVVALRGPAPGRAAGDLCHALGGGYHAATGLGHLLDEHHSRPRLPRNPREPMGRPALRLHSLARAAGHIAAGYRAALARDSGGDGHSMGWVDPSHRPLAWGVGGDGGLRVLPDDALPETVGGEREADLFRWRRCLAT